MPGICTSRGSSEPTGTILSTWTMTTPARIFNRLGDGEDFEGAGFFFHGDVAVLVGGGAAQQGGVDGEGVVEEPVPPGEVDELDEVFAGAGVELAAGVARVDEGAQPDVGDGARLAGGDIAEKVADDALGEVVGFDLVLCRQLAHARRQVPVPADHALAPGLRSPGG